MKTYLLFGGVALAALAVPALAQEETPTAYPESSGLDVPVDDGPAAPAAPTASTGDPVLDRLNLLETRLRQLEARNAELEAANSEVTTRVENVEVRAATAVQAGPAPTFSDVAGNFTFKPRGVIQLDYAGYNERGGGYDYNNGTDIRRARFGFDGTAFKLFKWRLDAEYVKGAVNLLDAYVSYAPSAKWLATVGQHKAPYGLEANTSDSFNTFLERGMFTNAFGAVGAERRVGASVGYVSDQINVTAGIFGAPEAVQRDATTPDEAYSGNIRATWEPILDTGKVVHLGASAFVATNFAGNTLTSIGDRPNTRVDGGRIIQATIAGTNPVDGPQTGAKDVTFLGAEAAVVSGPFSAQAEYGRLKIDRFGDAQPVTFDGFYAFGSWFVTGESRSFKNGNVDRLKPFTDFDGAGGLGALELAVRYDELDLSDTDLSSLEKKAHSWTGAVNWYLNPNTKLLFNYIRFKGTNSPLVVAPNVNGTTAKGDAFATRLHFDF